jgi:beta-lactamase superfamily II metal-dependent hydrolase
MWAYKARTPIRFLKAILATLVLCTCTATGFGQSEPIELIFLDVGQGDAVVVRSPEGKVALIDAGPGVDVVSLLGAHGIESIDIAISSHPHADRISGTEQVITSIPLRW